MRDAMVSVLALAVAMMAGCERPPKELQPLYCEGGVIRDQGQGDCLSYQKGGGGSTIVGTAHFGHASDKVSDFTVRRTGKNSYQLLYNPPPPQYTDAATEALRNTVAGTLEHNGFWIAVTIAGAKTSLRSDAPGALL